MYLALYKGPPTEAGHFFAHIATCIVTLSRYSHVELVIGGMCYSSSARDGGVRAKRIDLASGRWDVISISGDEARALAWFRAHEGNGYDWTGAARFLLPILVQRGHKWFCSEAVAAMLHMSDPHQWTPGSLARFYQREV